MTGGRFVAFAGMGSALPQRVVPNSYFESLIDTTDEWITVQNPGSRPTVLSIGVVSDGQAVGLEGLQDVTPKGGH